MTSERKRVNGANANLVGFVLALTSASAGFATGCGSGDPGCVSTEGYVCAKDLAGFPFAQDAALVSDFCSNYRQGCGTPPAGATVMTMTHPDVGTLCVSGSIKPGGFAVMGLEFPRKNADETMVLEPFDATAHGITQVALTVDSPPAQGADLLANAITHTTCPANPLDCQYPPNFKFTTITAAGPVTAPFAGFKSLDDPSETLDPSLLAAIFLQVGSGDFDFCIHDFNFLDAAGNPVRP
jgi:hypothetical protein